MSSFFITWSLAPREGLSVTSLSIDREFKKNNIDRFESTRYGWSTSTLSNSGDPG